MATSTRRRTVDGSTSRLPKPHHTFASGPPISARQRLAACRGEPARRARRHRPWHLPRRRRRPLGRRHDVGQRRAALRLPRPMKTRPRPTSTTTRAAGVRNDRPGLAILAASPEEGRRARCLARGVGPAGSDDRNAESTYRRTPWGSSTRWRMRSLATTSGSRAALHGFLVSEGHNGLSCIRGHPV